MDDYSDALALAPDGVRLPAFAQTPEQMAAGRRAKLELDLNAAQLELEAAQKERRDYDEQSFECRAIADEHRNNGKHLEAAAMNAASVRYRSRVIAKDVAIHGLLKSVATIEGQLSALGAPQKPVSFKAGQVEGQDETMDFGGVAA